MKTVDVPVYAFSELSPKAQQRAIESRREFESQEWDPGFEYAHGYGMLYEWANKMENDYGVTLETQDIPLMSGKKRTQPAVGYGFYTQGSGANFAGDVDLYKWLKAMKLGNKYRRVMWAIRADDIRAYIHRDGREVHEYAMTAHIETGHNWDLYADLSSEERRKLYEQEVNEVEEELQYWARQQAKELHRMLQDEYEGVTDEEYIREYLADNDDEIYTESGEIF